MRGWQHAAGLGPKRELNHKAIRVHFFSFFWRITPAGRKGKPCGFGCRMRIGETEAAVEKTTALDSQRLAYIHKSVEVV